MTVETRSVSLPLPRTNEPTHTSIDMQKIEYLNGLAELRELEARRAVLFDHLWGIAHERGWGAVGPMGDQQILHSPK